MREAMRNLTKLQRVKFLIDLFKGLLAFLIVACIMICLTVLLVRQQNYGNTIKSVHHIGDILIDCTTPGKDHECYNDSIHRTQQAVGDLNQIILATSFCAQQPGTNTLPELRACVLRNIH